MRCPPCRKGLPRHPRRSQPSIRTHERALKCGCGPEVAGSNPVSHPFRQAESGAGRGARGSILVLFGPRIRRSIGAAHRRHLECAVVRRLGNLSRRSCGLHGRRGPGGRRFKSSRPDQAIADGTPRIPRAMQHKCRDADGRQHLAYIDAHVHPRHRFHGAGRRSVAEKGGERREFVVAGIRRGRAGDLLIEPRLSRLNPFLGGLLQIRRLRHSPRVVIAMSYTATRSGFASTCAAR